MCKIFWVFMLALTAISSPLFSQESVNVPLEVKIQFMEDFISATEISWHRDSVNKNFIADFIHHSHQKSVAYNGAAERLYIRTRVSTGLVPEKIMAALNDSCYDLCLLEEIVKAETKEEVIYCFKVYSDGKYSELKFAGVNPAVDE
jgi:hypothetical protein